MYVPDHFRYDASHLAELLSQVGAGDLVTIGPDGPEATWLPFSLDPDVGEHGSLCSHMMRVNDQWKHAGPALVILHGPDDYIDPADHDKPGQVPTWNYITLHIHGQLVAHDDPVWIKERLGDLVSAQPGTWRMSDVPASSIDAMIPAIVGVELVIERIEGKAKMSQNKTSHDILSLADSLEQRREADTQYRYGRPSQQAIDFLRNESHDHAVAREELTQSIREAQRPHD